MCTMNDCLAILCLATYVLFSTIIPSLFSCGHLVLMERFCKARRCIMFIMNISLCNCIMNSLGHLVCTAMSVVVAAVILPN